MTVHHHSTKPKTNAHHQKVHHLTKTISAVSENALNTVDEALKNLQAQREEYTKSVETYVHKKPYAALGIAVAAGALLAILLRK